MDGAVKNKDMTDISAVTVAELVHCRQYAKAMDVLDVLAERAEAAEAACFLAQILRYCPEYKERAVEVLALNLQQLCHKIYVLDAGYQHYITVLYQAAAQNLAHIGFGAEAEMLLQQLNTVNWNKYAQAFLQERAVQKRVEPVAPVNVEPVLIDVVQKTETYQKNAENKVVSIENDGEFDAANDDVLDNISVEDDLVLPDVLGHDDTADFSSSDMLLSDDVENVAMVPETQLTEEVILQEQVAPNMVDEPMSSQPETPENVEGVSAEKAETVVAENNNEININKVLNINPNEIDKHFEQIKHITSEAVKKAELQAEKLKLTVQGHRFSGVSLSKIKAVAQQASAQSVQKVAAMAPAMQKLKGFAGKFLKKDN